MLSFEFSVFDLVLSVAVVTLIALFLAMLLKLNPSNEKKKLQTEETPEEIPEHIQHPQPSQPMQPQQAPQQSRPFATWPAPERTAFQKSAEPPRVVVGATTEGGSQDISQRGSTPPSEVRESPPKRPEVDMFSFKNSKNSNGKDCSHQFGYLKGLPKNTPIPEECFGCQRIVECLVGKKGK